MDEKLETATFAGGCFWCTEAIFKRLKGVVSIVSGYSGGKGLFPTYTDVSSKNTGFAECIQIKFDPKIISYDKLLEIFWATHDPTTPNQQGRDMGHQYRSIIFYHSEKQKKAATSSMAKLSQKGVFKSSIVTEIVSYREFYAAEEYHQDFYDKNPDYGYCSLVINPKIEKLLQKFGGLVKEEYEAPLTNASGIFSTRFVVSRNCADPLRHNPSEARAKNSSHSSTPPRAGRFSAKADKKTN